MKADRKSKVEAMLLHLLHSRTPEGKMWKAVTIPGIARFTRDDVEYELKRIRSRWWQFWKR